MLIDWTMGLSPMDKESLISPDLTLHEPFHEPRLRILPPMQPCQGQALDEGLAAQSGCRQHFLVHGQRRARLRVITLVHHFPLCLFPVLSFYLKEKSRIWNLQ